MADIKVRLEERKIAIENEFAALKQENDDLLEKGKFINKRLSEIRARQSQLQGAYKEVSDFLGGSGEVEDIDKAKSKK